MLVDYHIHTARCGHAKGNIEDYVKHASAKRLDEIGFADHLPFFHMIDTTITMSWEEFPIYVAEVTKLKSALRKPRIKVGVEVDYIPKYSSQIKEIVEAYDFDFVLGSVHFVDGWGIDDRRNIHNYEVYELSDLYERYFSLVVGAARSGLFDIIAHPDLIKKYFRLEAEPIDLYERVIKDIAETGVVLEVSSAGLRKPCKEPYPSMEFLKICRKNNVDITLSSDAHAPEQIGYAFNQLGAVLKMAGYSELAVFDGRNKRMVEIDWSALETL